MVFIDRRQRCKQCDAIIATDITTSYDDFTRREKCTNCGELLLEIQEIEELNLVD